MVRSGLYSLAPLASTLYKFFTPGKYTSTHLATSQLVTCLFDPALRLFMLSAQSPASLPSSASAFSAVRVGPSGRPVRHRGPSRQHVGPVLLGSWRHSLSGRAQCGCSVLVVPPGPGPACQRLASPGGGVIGLGFVSPHIPNRLRVVLTLPAHRPGLPRKVRGGAARCAAPVAALLGPLAGSPRLCPA